MIMRNKKADVAITLLVVMTLFLAGAALFIFLTQSSSKGEEVSINARTLESIYVEEGQIKFFLENIIKDKAKQVYDEKGEISIEDTKEKIKEELKKEYVYDAKEDKLNLAGIHPGGYDYWYLPFEKQSLPKIRERIKNNEFSLGLDLDNNLLKFSLDNFQIQRETEKLKVIYSTNIKIEIDVSEIILD